MSETSKVLQLTKNKINVGSFDDSLFQLSIKIDAEGAVSTSDPMDISVFDIFGFPCVPLTGNFIFNAMYPLYNHGNHKEYYYKI